MAINHRCTVISELNSSELGNHRVYPPRKDFDPGCASRCWGEMAVMRASAATNGSLQDRQCTPRKMVNCLMFFLRITILVYISYILFPLFTRQYIWVRLPTVI